MPKTMTTKTGAREARGWLHAGSVRRSGASGRDVSGGPLDSGRPQARGGARPLRASAARPRTARSRRPALRQRCAGSQQAVPAERRHDEWLRRWQQEAAERDAEHDERSPGWRAFRADARSAATRPRWQASLDRCPSRSILSLPHWWMQRRLGMRPYRALDGHFTATSIDRGQPRHAVSGHERRPAGPQTAKGAFRGRRLRDQ